MNKLKCALLLFVLLIGLSPTVYSADWQRINIGGGGAMNVVAAGVDGTLIAGTDLAGAYIKRPIDNKWQMLGPLNGLFDTHVTGVVFDKANANTILLATEGGIYRSANKGNSFTQVDKSTASSQFIGGKYLTLTRRGSRVYASRISEFNLSDSKILISRDGGNSFSFTTGSLPRPNSSVVTKLVIHPIHPNVVLALSNEERFDDERANASHKALYMSVNSGDSWVEIAQNISNILDVIFHPADADRVYISNTTSGDSAQVFRCTLNATSTSCNDALSPIYSRSGDGPPILMLWADNTNANVIRAININTAWSHDDPAAWKLTLQNNTWAPTSLGQSSDWAGSNANWDLGWSKKNGILNPTLASMNYTLGFDLSNPNRLLWATDQFVHSGTLSGNTLTFENLTTNGSDATSWSSKGLDNITPFILDVNAGNSNVIYAGLNDLGCTVSVDAGETWKLCINNSDSWLEGFNFTKSYGGTVTALISDPSPNKATNVWMFSAGDQNEPVSLQFSDDFGATWNLRHAGWNTSEVYGLSIGGSGLFVTVDGAVYRSTNSGASWTKVFSCGSSDNANNDGCRTTKVGPNGFVYAGGEAGFFVSKNNGNPSTWKIVLSKNKIQGLSGDVFQSGKWRGISGIAIAALNDPNHVYAAAFSESSSQGIYKCDVSLAITADQCDLILTNKAYIRDIAVDRNNTQNLYATSSSAYTSGGFDKDNSAGVLRSNNGGASWSPLNDGLDWPMAIPIQISPTNSNILYVGSPGGGNYKIDLSTLSSLAKPQLLSPLGTTTNPPVFKWNKVAGATRYKLFVNEYADPNVAGKIDQVFTAAEAGCTTNPVCEVSPNVSFKIAAGEWWVTAFKGEASTLSDSGTFTIVLPGTPNGGDSDNENEENDNSSDGDTENTEINSSSGGGLIALKWLVLFGFIRLFRYKLLT